VAARHTHREAARDGCSLPQTGLEAASGFKHGFIDFHVGHTLFYRQNHLLDAGQRAQFIKKLSATRRFGVA